MVRRPSIHSYCTIFNSSLVGMYMSGLFWGRIGDSRGPRPLLVGAFIFLLVGYSGIRSLFDAGLGEAYELSQLRFVLLVMCSLFTGIGGNAGIMSAINATAKSFPDQIVRATKPTTLLEYAQDPSSALSSLASSCPRSDYLHSSFLLSPTCCFRETHPIFCSYSDWARPCLWSLGFFLCGQFHFPRIT
jgi:MFS family permease